MLRQLKHQSESTTDCVGQSSANQQRSTDADRQLLQRVQLNAPGAMEELVEQHGNHLQRLIGNLVGWSSATDDVLQETFLKAWNSSHTYRGDAPIRHWLTQIAVRACRNYQRSYRRQFAHLKKLWEQRTIQTGLTSDSTVTQEDAMLQAISKLSYADREILVLHYLEGQSVSDVATQLGIRESSLHVRLHRSRERLKSLLKRTGDLS